MQCGQIRLLIPAYVKNELSVLGKLEVKHHFSQCPVCASRMMAMQAATLNRSGDKTEKIPIDAVKIAADNLFPKIIPQSLNEQLQLTASNGSNNEKEMGAEEVMEENLNRGLDTKQTEQNKQSEQAEPEKKREMAEINSEKPGFRPQKAHQHTAEQKLKDAGILVPNPVGHMAGGNASLAAARKREEKTKETVHL
ncbi:MAG TPA: zf-HC2 domain-containing protein, partial [Bacillota bacterium]|nr:zf-HC2 domain-containing protein [Bacillota bacterium]